MNKGEVLKMNKAREVNNWVIFIYFLQRNWVIWPPFSKMQSADQCFSTQVSHIAGRLFTLWATRESPQIFMIQCYL